MRNHVSKRERKRGRAWRTVALMFLCAYLALVPVVRESHGLGWGDVGRVVAAVATGGLSELVIRTTETLMDLLGNIAEMTATLAAGITETMNRARADIETSIGSLNLAFQEAKREIGQTSLDASRFVARYEGREVGGDLANAPGGQFPLQQNRDDVTAPPPGGSPASEPSGSQSSRPAMNRMERAGPTDLSAQTAQRTTSVPTIPARNGEQKCPEFEPVGGSGFGGRPGRTRTIGGSGFGGKVAMIRSVPVGRETALESLKRAEDRIRSLKSNTDTSLAYSLQQRVEKARAEVGNFWDSAKAQAELVLVAPLEGAADTVQYYIDHPVELIEASIDPLAPINQTIEEINASMDQALRDLYDTITREPMRTLRSDTVVRSANANAILAKEIYSKMTDLERCPTQSKVAALDALTNSSSDTRLAQAAQVQFKGMALESRPILTASRNHVQQARNDYRKISDFRAQFRSKDSRAGGVDQNTRLQASRELDALFLGKPPEEAERSKSRLITEVRKRFAKSPALVADVERYVDEQAKLRMAASSSAGAVRSTTRPPAVPPQKNEASGDRAAVAGKPSPRGSSKPVSVSLAAGGNPVRVPVTGDNLNLVRSAEVVKKANNREMPVPSAEVGVKPLPPTPQCPLPVCRLLRMSAGTSASGAYLVRLRDAEKRVVMAVPVLVRAAATGPTAVMQQQTAPLQAAQTTAQTAVLNRPDLRVISAEGQFVTVKNVGRADAVFSREAPLVSYGGTQVPAGGKINTGQTVQVRMSIAWSCPESITSEWQYPNYSLWGYQLEQPVDAQGKKMILVDPNGVVTEIDETNNSYLFRKPNEFRPAGNTSLPNLRVVEVTVYEEPSASASETRNVLRWRYKVKNIGSGYAFICDDRSLQQPQEVWIGGYIANVQIDGARMPQNQTFAKSPWTLAPNESKEMWDHTYVANMGQFGVMTEGIQPGCHEVKIIADPANRMEESDECDNETTTYYATGGATCPADKVTKVSTCPEPVRKGPVPMMREVPIRQMAPNLRLRPK